MSWQVHLLLALGPLVAIGVVFLGLYVLTRITGFQGYAPDWRFRCPKCEKTRDASEVGVIRKGAVSAGKVVFGYCSGCHGFRWLRLERKPESVGESEAVSAVD